MDCFLLREDWKAHTYNIQSDLGNIYILNVIVEEDHMMYKDEVKESCPLKFDYEQPTIFDPS